MELKTILVTGASSGIGECLALGLACRGHRVFASARRGEDLQRLADAGLEPVHLDLAEPDSVRGCAEQVHNRAGGVDVVINNAAYGQPGAVEDLSRAVLREQFEVNLFGTQELTNLLLPAMRERSAGRIIYISSVLGLAALPYRGAYVASKFALEGLADTLRLELCDSGIDVSLVEPGPIRSRFRENSYAAFQRNIDQSRSAHADTYRAVERRLTNPGKGSRFTLGPEAVLKAVVHAVENPRPRARYYVTVPTHLFGSLRRLLPTRLLDWILLKSTADERR